MVIVLPDEVEGLSSVLQKLASGHNIMVDIENMSPKKYLDIVIPKFKVETTIDMTDLLPKVTLISLFLSLLRHRHINTYTSRLFLAGLGETTENHTLLS